MKLKKLFMYQRDNAFASTGTQKSWKKKNNASKQNQPESQQNAHSALCKVFHLLEETASTRATWRMHPRTQSIV